MNNDELLDYLEQKLKLPDWESYKAQNAKSGLAFKDFYNHIVERLKVSRKDFEEWKLK